MQKFDELSKKYPKVKVIPYGEVDIAIKMIDLDRDKKATVVKTIKESALLLLTANVFAVLFLYVIGMYLIPPSMLEKLEVLLDINSLSYLNFIYLFACTSLIAVLGLLFSLSPSWWRKTTAQEAEFDLRAILCRPQLKDADDELVMQIFSYCRAQPTFK